MKKLLLIAFSLILFANISKSQVITWEQIGGDIMGEAVGDFSGCSLDFNSTGTVVAIGAERNGDGGTMAGHVRVYQNISGVWIQKGADIDGENPSDFAGCDVSISPNGNLLAVAELGNDDNGIYAGRVRIFSYNSGAWVQLGDSIVGEASSDLCGISVSIKSATDTIVAVGSLKNDDSGIDAGDVRVFKYSLGTWVQLGSDIDGEAAGDESGLGLDLNNDGTIIAIGGRLNDDAGLDAGHVRVYEYNGTAWTQFGGDIDGVAAGDLAGRGLSISDDGYIVAVGAYNNDSIGGTKTDAGQVRIFQYNSGTTSWDQLGDPIYGEKMNDYSGWSVDLSSLGDFVVIGSIYNDDNGSNSGHARIFQYSGGNWIKVGNTINGSGVSNYAGHAVKMSSNGSIISIAAYGNSASIGQVRMFLSMVYDTLNVIACDSLVSLSGNYTWTTSGTYYDTLQSAINIDTVITVYLTVNYSSSETINPIVCDSMVSPSGNYIWTTSGIYMDTIPNVVLCDSVITVNLTVNYSSSETINPIACDSLVSPSGNYTWMSSGTYMDTISNAVLCDSVITINLTVNNSNSETINLTECFSYTSPSGNYTWTNSGTYIDTIPNVAGCDSIMTINLTIHTIDTSVTQIGNVLVANAPNAAYIWVDCNYAYLPIIGETNQAFSPSANGSYAVILVENTCIDTSSCHTVSSIGIEENSFENTISVYPNPIQNDFTIEFSQSYSTILLRIENVNGELISEKIYNNETTIKESINAAKGIYILKITADTGERAVFRMIKL